jgi:HTH-type transcriptional regulator/antitoxin HigA
MKKQLKYETEAVYEAAMVEIERLMDKGEENLTEDEFETLETLALAAQAYEKEHYYVEPPRTLEGMIELRMYEMRLKQNDLAETLGVSDAELQLILSGEQKPDIPFIKAVHDKLNVSADFILNHI